MLAKSFVILFGLALVGGVLGGEVKKNTSKATFAGGCFWCMEGPFEKLEGVISVTSGYTGGKQNNPCKV